MVKRLIPDSTFFSFFLHNTDESDALKEIANNFYVEVPPKIHKEIQSCKNSYCLEELKDKLHIFDDKINGFSELLKPLFSEGQKEKGEHDIVVVGICYYNMHLDFILIIDDEGARSFAKRNFPFLEPHIEWTANFIKDCYLKYQIFNKPKTLDLLNKMMKSSTKEGGFRIKKGMVIKLIKEVEDGRY